MCAGAPERVVAKSSRETTGPDERLHVVRACRPRDPLQVIDGLVVEQTHVLRRGDHRVLERLPGPRELRVLGEPAAQGEHHGDVLAHVVAHDDAAPRCTGDPFLDHLARLHFAEALAVHGETPAEVNEGRAHEILCRLRLEDAHLLVANDQHRSG